MRPPRDSDLAYTRHQQPQCGETTVRVNPGGHYVTRRANEIIVTVLGSCVAACIRDPLAQVGGLNHFMLPESDSGQWGSASASLRFGNFAMERLINDVLARGGRRQSLEVKVFGGAAMTGAGLQVGLKNAEFVETYLRAEGLPIAASDLRGEHARRIHYWPLTGRVRLLTLRRDAADVAQTERGYASTLRPDEMAGSIELFE